MSAEKSGRIRLNVWEKSYRATWRVDGDRVLVLSAMGEGSTLLGGLASATAILASEKFKEIIKTAQGPTKVAVDHRFNVKDL